MGNNQALVKYGKESSVGWSDNLTVKGLQPKYKKL